VPDVVIPCTAPVQTGAGAVYDAPLAISPVLLFVVAAESGPSCIYNLASPVLYILNPFLVEHAAKISLLVVDTADAVTVDVLAYFLVSPSINFAK
jgi:hypothetical protein